MEIEFVKCVDHNFLFVYIYMFVIYIFIGNYTFDINFSCRLRTWVMDIQNTKCKQELSQILFPIFCHLYLDTLYENNGQVQSALVFFKRNQSFFTSDSLRDIMKDIGNTRKKEEVETKPLVKAFRYFFLFIM